MSNRFNLLPNSDVSVRVPDGEDGRIWSLSIGCERATIRLTGVPPLMACHPCELMVPAECLVPASRPKYPPVSPVPTATPAKP